MKTFPPHCRALACSLVALSIVTPSLFGKDQDSRRPQVTSRESEMVAESLADTPNSWNTIRDLPYEKRADFTAIFTRMVAKLDDEIRALNAKRENMTNDTRDWDFAMKELVNARTDVQSKQTELGRANTPETWTDAKEKLGVAWDRAQVAVRNVRNSTTS
jgi:hypothetical protein